MDINCCDGPSPQTLADRELWANGTTSAKRIVTEGLPKWDGKALLASIGADAFGGVGDALEGIGGVLAEV